MQACTPAHISAPRPKQEHVNTWGWGGTGDPEEAIARVYEKRGSGTTELIETLRQKDENLQCTQRPLQC